MESLVSLVLAVRGELDPARQKPQGAVQPVLQHDAAVQLAVPGLAGSEGVRQPLQVLAMLAGLGQLLRRSERRGAGPPNQQLQLIQVEAQASQALAGAQADAQEMGRDPHGGREGPGVCPGLIRPDLGFALAAALAQPGNPLRVLNRLHGTAWFFFIWG